MSIDYPEFDGTQNCFGVSTEQFYIDDGERSTKVDKKLLEEAKELCSSCSYLKKCRDYAIKREKYGVWGGTTPKERVAIREELGIPLDSREHSNAMRKLLYKREEKNDES